MKRQTDKQNIESKTPVHMIPYKKTKNKAEKG